MPPMEPDSGPDSANSTPAIAAAPAVVRLMVSFGGKILPRPTHNQLRYVGGDTRIVAVNRSACTFSSLVSKLSKLLPHGSTTDFTVKYQLPNEDLDSLITVSSDEDVDNMLDEFDRLVVRPTDGANAKVPRLRLFLFSNEDSRTTTTTTTADITSLLDGSRNRESWFLDALNGGLERNRSEVSSIVSEVPDYLFGLENPDDLIKNRVGLCNTGPGSDPGSPALASSPFCSTSSAPPAMLNLPRVKTKPDNPVQEAGELTPVYPAVSPVWSHHHNPGSPYPAHAVQAMPFYYVPAGPVPGPVSVPVLGPENYVQQYGPVGYHPGSGPVYGVGAVRTAVGGGVDPNEMAMHGNMGPGPGGANQAMYYRVKNGYPGMVVPVTAEEVVGFGSDASKGRTLQG